QAQERGLAGDVGADESDALAGAQVERQVGKQRSRPESSGQSLSAQQHGHTQPHLCRDASSDYSIYMEPNHDRATAYHEAARAVELIAAELLSLGAISGRAARHLFQRACADRYFIASSEVSRVLTIYIDADACPVKDEVYRVARRYEMRVAVVANAPLRIPPG